jgi:tetrahydromethanopterin S-methyltransferase subunit E
MIIVMVSQLPVNLIIGLERGIGTRAAVHTFSVAASHLAMNRAGADYATPFVLPLIASHAGNASYLIQATAVPFDSGVPFSF